MTRMGSSSSTRPADRHLHGLDRSGQFLGISSVNIFVRDQERALEFYTGCLGFHLAFDARLQTGERWVAVSPPDGSAVLALVAPAPDSFRYKLIGRRTQVVLVTEDVLATYREWSRRGVHFRYAPRLRRVVYSRPAPATDSAAAAQSSDKQTPVWGGVFTRFDDLDGNSFELVSFDEVSRLVETRRRAAAEKLEAERRAAQELEIARQVQARLFPQKMPFSSTLEYAGVCLPASQVGGDYYDFLDLGHQRLGLVIGDIAGKGIAAALLMANLQANLRGQCANASDQPRGFLRAVNELFCGSTTDSAYATLFFAEYDDVSRRLRYINCGHLSALLLHRDGGLERLDSTATVLGIFPDWDCSIAQQQLAPGDTLALYTDGITEAWNTAGEDFGETRLVQSLVRHCHLSSCAALEAIIEEVRGFSAGEQRDDITLIVAKCKASHSGV